MDKEKKQVEEALLVLADVCYNNIVCETCPLFEDICDGETMGFYGQMPLEWLNRR